MNTSTLNFFVSLIQIGIGLENKFSRLSPDFDRDFSISETIFSCWYYSYPRNFVRSASLLYGKLEFSFLPLPDFTRSDICNFVIKFDTDNGVLYFGDGKGEMKKSTSNMGCYFKRAYF